jgi:hypothetical protein
VHRLCPLMCIDSLGIDKSVLAESLIPLVLAVNHSYVLVRHAGMVCSSPLRAPAGPPVLPPASEYVS